MHCCFYRKWAYHIKGYVLLKWIILVDEINSKEKRIPRIKDQDTTQCHGYPVRIRMMAKLTSLDSINSHLKEGYEARITKTGRLYYCR